MSIDFDNDPRLSIINVANLCGITNLKMEGFRYTTTCPFCGGKPGHFYLTPEDPRKPNFKNVYRCVKCGESGSQINLYYKLHNCNSTKEAFNEIMGYNNISSSIKKTIKKHKDNIKNKQDNLIPLAPIDRRDTVYRELLKRLSLNRENFNNLINRGLTYRQIREGLYATLPKDKGFKVKICNELIQLGLNLEGIPGFYLNNQKRWTFWTPKEGGFLIPVLSIDGKIQGCQIRKNVISKKKYPWFSSSYMESGTQASGFIHVHWNSKHSAKKVVITEGPLKADISSLLSDTTFVAIPGVWSFEGLAPILKEMNASNIFIAYDMDKNENNNVLKALKYLKAYLKKEGFRHVKTSNWSRKYKGIDDYLYYIKRLRDMSKNYRIKEEGVI